MVDGFILLETRALISVSGSEAGDFLQRIITNDVDRLASGEGRYAALLTPQGKYLFDFFVIRWDDGFLLDCEAERAGALMKRLKIYRLRADVTLGEVSTDFAVAAIFGGEAAVALKDGIIFADPRAAALDRRAILPRDGARAALAALGLEALDMAEYESRRIALAVPDGSRDFEPEKSGLLEMNVEELNGVDFSKGCFVGQEVTARTKHRALVRKRLLPVRLVGAAPEPGARITADGSEVGAMRSAQGDHGLALMRLDRLQAAADKGLTPMAGETKVLPRAPAWADFQVPTFD